jgi:hypothetical protein
MFYPRYSLASKGKFVMNALEACGGQSKSRELATDESE